MPSDTTQFRVPERLTLFLMAGSMAGFCMNILVSFLRPMAAAMWRGVSWFCDGARWNRRVRIGLDHIICSLIETLAL